MGQLNEVLVSGVYIVHGSENAYYSVSVNDRELMARNVPVGHSILYKAIIVAKNKGFDKFIVGDYNQTSDDKINAITKYKKGFVDTISCKAKYLVDLPV